MADQSRFLDTFPTWLKSLGADASALADLVREGALPEAPQRSVIGSLHYLIKSLDLIPDGIEDIGFLDDAFVLRVAARQALAASGRHEVIERLGGEASLVGDFLGADTARLETYVQGLTRGTARGRSVDDILSDEAARTALLGEIAGWVASYSAPTFTRDDRTLVKLRSFLDTKLPR